MDTIVLLAIVIICGLIALSILRKFKLPALIGFLVLGFILGPYCLKIINTGSMPLYEDICTLALVIIVFRGGLGLQQDHLRSTGNISLRLGILPCLLEGFTIAFLSMVLFNFTFIQGALLGFIISATSPAIVIPQMLSLMKKGYSRFEKLASTVLAGSSVDCVLAITLFSIFFGMYFSSSINLVWTVVSVPLAFILAFIIGAVIAIVLIKVLDYWKLSNVETVLLVLAVLILIHRFSDYINQHILPFAGVLCIVILGIVFINRRPDLGARFSDSFAKFWVLAEMLLFIFVAASANLPLAWSELLNGIIIVCSGLVARSIGVYISLWGTEYNIKEKIYCMIVYGCKATVQAALGALPLLGGVAGGELILAISVISIILTAPTGALIISLTEDKLLDFNKESIETLE